MKFSTIFASFCLLLVTLSGAVTLDDSVADADFCEKMLRIHVVANSDSVEDQSVKLLVKDAVQKKTKTLFSDCNSIEEAIDIASNNKDLLENVANEVLAECKKEYTARVEIGKKLYDDRILQGITFPCGEYMSLRIVIGNGEGQNWWGVLFPSVFYEKDDEEKSTNVGKIIFGCRMKLKILDYLN